MLITSEKIRIICKRRNITMGELADKLNISRQNLSNKLTRNNFNESELCDIARALNCTFISKFKFNDSDDTI